MQPDDRDAGLLWRIRKDGRDALALAAELTPEKLRESMRDQRAISHAVEQVGEAASRLSPAFRDAHPDVPWRRIIGVRNRLAHDYAGTDWEIIWLIVTESIPDLLEALDRLIPEDEPGAAD